MAARTLHPSEYEIQREVEALRDIRRRSTTQGALIIDPDLPDSSLPSSPTTSYWSGGSTSPSSLIPDGDSSSSSHESGSSFEPIEGTSTTSHVVDDNPTNPADDPFHLFWVPARLHPEIAPAGFREFLKEHARSPSNSDGSTLLDRSPSVSSTSSLGRKKSMLSRQYKPSENDGVEDEKVVPLRRNRSSLYVERIPQLTMSDLQRLEELAEEASTSDDPSRLRNVLRRSLSLNISPSAIGQMEEIPEMGDEADAPIIVPPPGQILRRTARTRIRKPGLAGDGGGHRFGSSRRGKTSLPHSTNDTRTSSELSTSDHGDESGVLSQRRQTFSDDGSTGSHRPDSFTEETMIYGYYARDDEEEDEFPAPVIVTSPDSPLQDLLPPSSQPPPPALPVPIPEVPPVPLEPAVPIIHQPQPQRLLAPQPTELQTAPSRTPSPSAAPNITPSPSSPAVHTPPSTIPVTSSPPSAQQRKDKEKDKKGLFGKWSSDKGAKKSAKDRENRERASAEKEKDSSFFGSLFGGGKKKQEDPPPLVHGVNAGREAAQALLGASKSSKQYVSPSSPGLAPGPNSYARYPIHVERAIYRLSHIKLANPRRPLYEQVLISNLMFWYLGVINKAQNQSPTTATSGANGTATTTGGTNGQQVTNESNEIEVEQREKEEREQRERQEREKAEKEKLERERSEKEQRDWEIESRKKESGRRSSLTKSAAGSPAGGRRAEMPIKGPQYEMQHRVMEQEYSGYSGQHQQQQMNRTQGPNNPANGQLPQQYPRMQQQPPHSYVNQQKAQQQLQPQISDNFYYSQDNQPLQQQQQRLPPGAMPPADKPTWIGQQQSQPMQRGHTSPSPPPGPQRRSRSPPVNYGQQPVKNNFNMAAQDMTGAGGNRIPGRSLSATASVSTTPWANGGIHKDPTPPIVGGRRPRTSEGRPIANGTGEEEDMPLAMWQQQRRK